MAINRIDEKKKLAVVLLLDERSDARSGSGPSEMTGWIVVLFPYIKTFDKSGERLVPSPYLTRWERGLRIAEKRTVWSFEPEGPHLGAIPSSLASAPVRFVDVRDGVEHNLPFVAGLFGTTQDQATGALKPEFGWAVVHDEAH